MRNSFAPLGSDSPVSSAHSSPVFAAASATMPGNDSAPSTSSASSAAAIKLPDLSWVPELKTSHDWKSQEKKVCVAFAKDFKTWRRSFKFTTKFIMTFVEKEEHVVALWVLALLCAFKAFPSLQEEVHLSVGEGKEKADLLETISVEVTRRKSLDKDTWQDIFLKLERGQHGREDIVKAMKRLKNTIRKCGTVGYKPDTDVKHRALKSMLTKSEWNDSIEKASLKTGNKVSELTYDEILVHVNTKVDATEDYEITQPVDGRLSSSPPKCNHEFGTAADRSQRPKGRSKGRPGKKSNRKEKSFQGKGDEESQS
uniref:Uncharacterized protein n=1 Tax=Chromera velia CCMP2878 TaxID=1169474 RepID=A0A0G4I8T2_9ALVE|eukprot:Cvel_11956.t1-p1 / transcript=Cvel_11956.t1 / gene=Cvel_11956 / organism=Chromera_velia_CCMP2878 / gene_product=hypothetical protein / transcript_product=hypothetical protein / location=Cvel_scaffold766:30301-31233(+) / protein_length=311 / sequence_SO=supercontig / SO=protein_coding / is_pseudo=false